MASRFTKLQPRIPRTAPFIPEKQSANGHRNAQQSCACTSSCSCTSRSSCWRTYGASAELLPSVIKLSALYPYDFALSIRFSNGKTRIGKKHKTLSHSGRGFCEESFRICTQTSCRRWKWCRRHGSRAPPCARKSRHRAATCQNTSGFHSP